MNKIQLKKCINCGEEKEEILDNFYWVKTSNRFENQCKICLRKKSNDRNRIKHPKKPSPDILYSPNGHRMKICSNCEQKKEENDNNFYREGKSSKFRSQCIECLLKEERDRYANNKEKINIIHKEYRDNNVEKEKSRHKIYYEDNKEKIAIVGKNYYENNKEHLMEKLNKRRKERWATDPIFKCRMMVSSSVNRFLKRKSSSKMDERTWKQMPYESPEVFVKHIEDQWTLLENLDHDGKIWMNWQNHGVYDPKIFNEKDSSTWAWQIDHRKPHSEFLYDSLKHPDFKKAWAPENIRPLRADINVKEGQTRARHTKK